MRNPGDQYLVRQATSDSRQHNSNYNKTSCYYKAHYSKDIFWVLGATFDVFKVHFKPFEAI